MTENTQNTNLLNNGAGNKKPLHSRAAHQIKYFFMQTFRRRSGREYSELLTRGLREDKVVNRTYPWAYLRLFAMLFILYAVFLLIIRFTGNELFAPTLTVLASVMFNLPFLCLMFELYPERDLSFITVLFVMLVGGTAACVISQALFNLFPSPNVWLKAVYAGFFEEIPKAGVAVIAIVMAKKRSPLSGFLFGAAVGCGFSVVEDMGYVFVMSNELPALNLTTLIEVSISRGFTAFCTHTLWTALVGWAYCHFNRHLYNVFNYVAVFLICGLHICWDLPLNYLAQVLVCTACIIVAEVAGIAALAYERKAVFRAAGVHQTDENYYKLDKTTVDVNHYLYWKHWGNFALTLCAFLLAVISVIYCSIPFRETYGTETFTNAKEFVAFMQDGREFEFDNDRFYDRYDTANDKLTMEDGIVTAITQTEVNGGLTYSYRYNVVYDDVHKETYYLLSTISVDVNIDGRTEKILKEDLYNDGKLYASFFRLNREVTGFNFEADGDITVFIYDANFVRDLSEPRYVALFATFAGVFGVSLICYIALVIKSRRVKKLCSTTTASSAK